MNHESYKVLSRSVLQEQIDQVSGDVKDALLVVMNHHPDVYATVLCGRLQTGIGFGDEGDNCPVFGNPSWILEVQAVDPKGVFETVLRKFTPEQVPILFAAFKNTYEYGKAATKAMDCINASIARREIELAQYRAQAKKIEELLS